MTPERQKEILSFIKDNKIMKGEWFPKGANPAEFTHMIMGNEKNNIQLSACEYSEIRKFIRVPHEIGETMFLLNEHGRKVMRDDKR